MDLNSLKNEINKFLNQRDEKTQLKNEKIYFFVKPKTAKVIQKFVKEKILNEYRSLEDFNSYIDLCFGSGNLSVHILEALEFFEDNQAKIKEDKKVVFNDKYNFANWELREKIEGIDFIQKDVFTADFFEDDHITDKEDVGEEEPDELSMFITYLKYRDKILDNIKSSYGDDFSYDEEKINEEKIILKKGEATQVYIKEKEVLLGILNKKFEFSDKKKKEEFLNKIIEETKRRVEKKYIPKIYDFITANFSLTDKEENLTKGIIRLTEKRETILNVIFEYFLSEKGVFLFVKKTSSEKDFEELKNIFGENADYITVFNIPKMTNEVNFIFKELTNQEQQEVMEIEF